jgi:phosphomannomutase
MTLISSISGIRGTIGGEPGNNLTPEDIIRFTKAFGLYIRHSSEKQQPTVVIGRDARVSGPMVESLVSGTLAAMGIHSLIAGLTTTPTTELAVRFYQADGGIIITASHNPAEWNALKLLNKQGEFLTQDEGKIFNNFLQNSSFSYVPYNLTGNIQHIGNFIDQHIQKILALSLVDVQAIREAKFTIVADVINSAGAVAIEHLLRALDVSNIHILNGEPTGIFAHNPEPLPSHLTELSKAVVNQKANLGIAVDPDVDRLALVMENGEMFGEEYTLVAVADYVIQNTPGNTVSNLSSTRALKDITQKAGYSYTASAVGEVNVVRKMKETEAVIGGEGNGGVIYPEIHYGRDALTGIALFLTYLARSGKTMTQLRKSYPEYFIAKHKISTEGRNISFEEIKTHIQNIHEECQFDETDGLKLFFPDDDWVHLRNSNTEPIIRVYAESTDAVKAESLAKMIINDVKTCLQ